MTSSNSKTDSSIQTEVVLKKPEFYKLIIHNDNTTPIEVVMYVLNTVCDKGFEESKKITMEAHESGSSVVGVYVKSKAESMRDKSLELARQYGYGEFTITAEKTN